MTTPEEVEARAETWTFANNVPHTLRDSPSWEYDLVAFKAGWHAREEYERQRIEKFKERMVDHD